MRRLAILAGLGLAGCPQAEEEYVPPEFPRYYCGTDGVQVEPTSSTNPGIRTQELSTYPAEGKMCWMVEYDEDPDRRAGPVRLTRPEEPNGRGFDELARCELHGDAQDGMATLTGGGCTYTGPGGHARFTFTEPVSLDVRSGGGTAQLRLIGDWSESRGEDVVIGRAAVGIYNYSGMNDLVGLGLPYPRYPVAPAPYQDAFGSCAVPRCFRVAFAGRGEVVSGGDPPCADLLASFAQPFDVVVGADGRIAFASDPGGVPEASWLPGAPAVDRCATRAFTGQRGGPVAIYDLAWDGAAPAMTMDLTQLHTANNVTSLCRTRWTAPLTTCD